MNNLTREILSISAAVFMLSSCVNKDYDLNKPIDMTMNLLPGISAPIGNYNISLTELLEIEGIEDSGLETDEAGNLFLKFSDNASEDSKVSVNLPVFSFSADIPMNTGSVSSEQIPYYASNETSPVIPLEDIKLSFYINQTEGIPQEIVSLDYAKIEGNANISISFSTNPLQFRRFYLTAGSTILFPEWLVLNSAPAGFKKLNDYTLQLISDLAVPSAGYSFMVSFSAIDFSKFKAGEGFENGIFVADCEVLITSNAYVNYGDVNGSPATGTMFTPAISIESKLSEITVNEIKGIFDPQIRINDYKYYFDELPDFINAQSAVLDFDDLKIDFKIDNGSPIPAMFNFNIETSSQNETLKTLEFRDLKINANQLTNIRITEDGTSAPQGYVPVAKEGLNAIMMPLPEILSIKDIECNAEQCSINLKLGESYDFEFNYDVIAPLSFGDKLHLDYPYLIRIKEQSEELAAKAASSVEDPEYSDSDELNVLISSLKLNADIINTVPLNMEVECEICDLEGNPLDAGDVSIEVTISDDVIKAGSTETPSTNALTIDIKGLTTDVNIEAINLHFTADGDAVLKGICLNENQGLSLEKIRLSLPEGVTIYNQLD